MHLQGTLSAILGAVIFSAVYRDDIFPLRYVALPEAVGSGGGYISVNVKRDNMVFPARYRHYIGKFSDLALTETVVSLGVNFSVISERGSIVFRADDLADVFPM